MIKLIWSTQQRKVVDLLPYEFNPRKMTAQKSKKLRESLEKFGLVEIPVINFDGILLAGHQRCKAMVAFGRIDELIDVRVPNRQLTDQEFKEYNIASNAIKGDWVDQAVIRVPESQGDIYRKCSPADEVVTRPDSVIGLQAKRNWIYKHFGSVFMIDDDISAVRRIYTDHGEQIMMEPKEVYDLIQHSADVARQIGIYLFGFADTQNPLAYNPMKPIQLSGWVNGCAFGLLAGSGLWWDTAITCNCDYWISALSAYEHRMAYLDKRFYFNQVDTFMARGGQAEHRNIDAEEKDFSYLTSVFGSEAIMLKKGRSLRHPFQKTLKLPF